MNLKTLRCIALVLIISFWTSTLASAQSILRVDGSLPQNGDGSSWTNAYNNLQSALSNVTPGNEIWVANAIYIPGPNSGDTFQLVPDVEVYGGFEGADSVTFPGGETLREQRNADPATNGTVLSGDIGLDDNPDGTIIGTNTSIIVHGAILDIFAILDGFTITGASDTAFLNNNNSSPRLRNLMITLNQSFGSGAAIRNLLNSSPVIRDCTFANNLSFNMGGAMFNQMNSLPIITGCTFTNNTAFGDGGAIYSTGNSDLQLTDCTFDGNSASGFGGGGNTPGRFRGRASALHLHRKPCPIRQRGRHVCESKY